MGRRGRRASRPLAARTERPRRAAGVPAKEGIHLERGCLAEAPRRSGGGGLSGRRRARWRRGPGEARWRPQGGGGSGILGWLSRQFVNQLKAIPLLAMAEARVLQPEDLDDDFERCDHRHVLAGVLRAGPGLGGLRRVEDIQDLDAWEGLVTTLVLCINSPMRGGCLTLPLGSLRALQSAGVLPPSGGTPSNNGVKIDN